MAKDMYDALAALKKATERNESLAGYVSELDEIESLISSADHNAQSASGEASSLSGELPNNLTEGLCHAIDSIEGECDECQSNVESALSLVESSKGCAESLLEDVGTALKAARDSLVKNRDLEDTTEVEILDELFKLVTGTTVAV